MRAASPSQEGVGSAGSGAAPIEGLADAIERGAERVAQLVREQTAALSAELARVKDELAARIGGAVPRSEWELMESALTAERKRSARLEADAAYYKHRLQTIVPLFEEARDALCAIPLASAKLRNIDLSLGARMDVAGTYSREEWDAALTPTAKEQT